MSNTTSSRDSSSQPRGEGPPPPAPVAGAEQPRKPWAATLVDLGDDDRVADGGTQIMRREPGQGASIAPVSDHPSSLAALTAALDAKKREGGPDVAEVLQARPVVGKKPARVQPTLPSRVATAIGGAGLPPAPKTEPDLEDLAFEQPPERKIDRTQPFHRGLFGRGVGPTLESPVWQPRPSAPSHAPVDRRPTSIAPISVDVSRSMPPSWSHPPASFAAPRKSLAPVIAAVIAGCVALCAVAVIALVAIKIASRSSEDVNGPTFAVERDPYGMPAPSPARPPSFALPYADDDATSSSVPPTPLPRLDDEPTTAVGALPPASASSGTGKGSKGARSVATGSGEPAATTPRSAPKPAKGAPPAITTAAEPVEPPPQPVATTPPPAPPPPRVAAPAPTTGVVQVSPSLMTVMVDGGYRRVSGGRVVVTCGRHKINAGRGTQVVDVPCGGVATVP